jgi:hypothetical protein
MTEYRTCSTLYYYYVLQKILARYPNRNHVFLLHRPRFDVLGSLDNQRFLLVQFRNALVAEVEGILQHLRRGQSKPITHALVSAPQKRTRHAYH